MELFGSMPDAVKFVIVFLAILGILVPLLWRRFSAGSSPLGARGRQPRLAVIDTTAVDVRRKLVLIKRDNVEHLLLIGGPSDIVVESGIARTATAAREPRPIPDIGHPEVSRQPAAADAPNWSLPLEPMARPTRTVDLDAALPEPAARTAREAMVDSMRAVRSGAAARRNAPGEFDAPPEEVAAPVLTPSPAEVNHRPPPVPETRRAAPQEVHRPQPALDVAPPPTDAPEPKRERVAPAAPRQAPAAAAPASGVAPSMPRSVQPVPQPAAGNPPPPPRPVQPAASAGMVPPAPRPTPSDESSLADVAQRLEAALRRPTKPEAPPPMRPPVRSEPPAGRRSANAKSPDPPPDLKVMAGKGKAESAIESLEDEMAKMLGRPGKS
jgi:flagellar protein FliO/FliZ